MWVEFVVGSLPCSERFFSGYSGFPLSLSSSSRVVALFQLRLAFALLHANVYSFYNSALAGGVGLNCCYLNWLDQIINCLHSFH